MSALITLDGLCAETPDARPLFSNLTLSLPAGRAGLVGPNGSGKSTLLKILAGRYPAARGSVRLSGSAGLLDQTLKPHWSRWAQALGIAADWSRLQRIEAGTGDEDDFAAADWTLESRVEAALDRVGLRARGLDESLAGLSGGERTRLCLAGLILRQPDILLLDEPTNNLDRPGRRLVRDVIETWPGAVLVASHDRELLEDVDCIVSLSPSNCLVHPGGWTAFAAERAARLEQAETGRAQAEAELRQLERAAQRGRERKARTDAQGRKARRDGSQSKLLLNAERERAQATDGRSAGLQARRLEDARDRLDEAQSRLDVLTPLNIDLPAARLGARETLIDMHQMTMRRGGRVLFSRLDFALAGPERVRITGPNGSGKTTFLNLVAGRAMAEAGEVRIRSGAIAMLDQHVSGLDNDLSLVENFARLNPSVSAADARSRLARFGFRNRSAEKPAAALSGGERMRAGLAVALAADRPPKLLILDEPTNHLDLDAVELMETSLSGFTGAVLLVSHDEQFCRAIGVTREVGLA